MTEERFLNPLQQEIATRRVPVPTRGFLQLNTEIIVTDQAESAGDGTIDQDASFRPFINFKACESEKNSGGCFDAAHFIQGHDPGPRHNPRVADGGHKADDCGTKYGDDSQLSEPFSLRYVQDVSPRVVDGGHKADDCGRKYGDGFQRPEPFSQRHIQDVHVQDVSPRVVDGGHKAEDCGRKYGDGFQPPELFLQRHIQDVSPRVVDGGQKADDCGKKYGDGSQLPEPIRNDTSKMSPQEWSTAATKPTTAVGNTVTASNRLNRFRNDTSKMFLQE